LVDSCFQHQGITASSAFFWKVLLQHRNKGLLCADCLTEKSWCEASFRVMPKAPKTSVLTANEPTRLSLVTAAVSNSLLSFQPNANSLLEAIRPQKQRSSVRVRYEGDAQNEKKQRNALASQRNRESKMEYDARLDLVIELLAAEVKRLETLASTKPSLLSLSDPIMNAFTLPLDEFSAFLDSAPVFLPPLTSASPFAPLSACPSPLHSESSLSQALTPTSSNESQSASITNSPALTELPYFSKPSFSHGLIPKLEFAPTSSYSKSTGNESIVKLQNMENPTSQQSLDFSSSIWSAVPFVLQWRLTMIILVLKTLQGFSILTKSDSMSTLNLMWAQPQSNKACSSNQSSSRRMTCSESIISQPLDPSRTSNSRKDRLKRLKSSSIFPISNLAQSSILTC
jgi:hypothetical protein